MSMTRMRSFAVALTFYVYTEFLSHLPSYGLRNWYLKHILRLKIGDGAAIHMGCFFTGRQVSIGSHSVINRDCYIDGRGEVEIGDNASISPGAYIISLTHDPSDEQFGVIGKKVTIGDHVWIGARAIITPGVVLGKGGRVGAGAVVTKSFEPYSIVAGVPAQLIGRRNANTDYTLSYFPYFNTDIQV